MAIPCMCIDRMAAGRGRGGLAAEMATMVVLAAARAGLA
jgi:hypothetical protein